MKQHFNERWFKVTSPNADVKFVVVGRDQLGWKMDVHGSSDRAWPGGDTYQDTFDELVPFLARYVDTSSVWSDFDTDETLPMWDALVSETANSNSRVLPAASERSGSNAA